MQYELQNHPMHPQRDGLTISFEIVLTPALFGLMGHGLDRGLGTSPLFLVTLTLATFVTVVAMTIWRYNTEMDEHDAERRARMANRSPRPARWEQRAHAISVEASR